MDKLEEVLAREISGDDSDDNVAPLTPKASLAATSSGENELVRESKFPRPPSNPKTPFDLNGEKFQREYFSPQGGILDAWLRAIRAANSSIKIGMFGFYSREAADALLDAVSQHKEILQALAEKRKTNPSFALKLVLDAGQSTLAKFDKSPENPNGTPVNLWFRDHGIDVKVSAGPNPNSDPMFEKLHSKYIVADDKFVITGSFNLSPTAENYSFENGTVLMDPLDVAVFIWDFERLYLRGWVPGRRTAPPAPLAWF